MSEIGAAEKITGTLPASQTITIDTDGSGDAIKGYIAFYTFDRPADDKAAQWISSQNLGAVATIHGTTADGNKFDSTVPAVPTYESRFTLPFDNRYATSTAVVLLNSDTERSPLKIVVRDKVGTILAEDSSGTLDRYQQTTLVLADVFPQTAGKVGVLQVSTSAVGLSALGVRLDASGRFTTVQTFSTTTNPDAPKQPAPTGGGTLPGLTGNSCASIEGAVVFANDGQYVGKITANTTDLESLGNPYGNYGSQYSSTSIFNSYGVYGGLYAALSPFNPYTTTPPIIYINNKPVTYLTANTTKTPRLSPQAIYPCINRN